MIKRLIFLSVLILSIISPCEGQAFIKTTDLFKKQNPRPGSGSLNIVQDPRVDTLISRYILYKRNMVTSDEAHSHGMEGFRIQIYSNSSRNAREESNKVRAEFISNFPDILSYSEFAPPGYFKIRVGDFRTKVEGTKFLFLIRKQFPNAYIVPCVINFPDLNNKQL
jgi:hypothetical protein